MTFAVLLVCLALGQGAPPPPPPPPPPGMTVAPMTGTAAVQVRIVSEATGRPVKGANVIIIVESAAATYTKATVSDLQGRAWLLGLAKGRVRVSATHQGYITSVSGSATPGDMAFSWIPVVDGQDLAITLKMRRGSVIAGVVTDEQGEPMPGVQVTAYRRDTSSGSPRFARFAIDETDDRGAYRIGNLQPGAYVVGVVPKYIEGSADRPNFAVFDPDLGVPDGEGQAATASLLSIGDGRVVLMDAAAPLPAVLLPDGSARGFASVFYAGAPLPARATTIDVGAAETKSAVDLRMDAVRLARITGVIGSSTGVPVGDMRVVLTAADDSSVSGDSLRWMTEPGANGEFGFAFVPAGRYLIEAVAPGLPANSPLAASVPVTVDDSTTRLHVDVRLQPGPRVSGRVQISDAERRVAGDLRNFGAVLSPRGGFSPSGLVPPRRVTLAEDGSFDFGSIAPGEYTVAVTGGSSSAWYASSAIVDGREILDASLKVAVGGDVADMLVTLTSKRSEIVGRVRAANGTPTSDGYVIAFSSDRELWMSTRRTFGVRPDADGQYRIRSVPPGDYFVVTADAQAGQWRDAAFLDGLVARAVRATVREGEIVSKDIKR